MFQQQEMKRALHQYALGLFIQVWEEVSTILIDDIINSPSSPFIKMLSVFSRKEYQANVGNILHIHLPGKNRQLSEQSRTELSDLIRTNVVDFIKTEEVDDLIKEGLIENKDDIIQVQLDGLTYLIHTCNS